MQGPRTLWDHEVQERPLSDVHRWVSQGMFFCSSIWQGPHERRSAIKPLTARNIDLTNDGSDWGPDSRGSWGLRTRVFFIKFLLQRSPNPQVWLVGCAADPVLWSLASVDAMQPGVRK